MSAPLTPANDVWDGDPIVPDEGEEITAVTTGPGKGPLRRALQRLLDKIWSVVQGKVSLRALVVGPTGGSAVNPTAGQVLVESLVVSPNYLGDQSSMQNYVEVSSLLAPIGAARLRGGRLSWTGVTTGAAEGGNPPRTQPIKNELRPLLVPKAWLYYKTDGASGFTEIEGANILTVDYPGGNLLRITLAEGLADEKMCVTPHAKLGNDTLFPSVNRNAPNIVILDFSKADSRAVHPAVAINPAAIAGIEVHVLVHGRQT